MRPLLLLVLLLGGCASMVIGPGPVQVIGLQTSTTLSWTPLYNSSNYGRWTIDGALLNDLTFRRIEDGRLLSGQRPSKSQLETMPVFRSTMDDSGIRDLIVDEYRRLGAVDPQWTDLRPAALAGSDGIRFELRFSSRDGLIYRSLHLAAKREGTLYWVAFDAPAEHYWDLQVAEVESIMAGLHSR